MLKKLRFHITVAIVCAVVLCDAQSQSIPNLGDGVAMTPAAERRLGDRIARELYRDPDYLDDAILGDYVQGIWQPLLAAARARGELPAELDSLYAWQILLGKDRQVNAFALPGAYFGLNLGLVGIVTTRDELASVLAHELSHVLQRHVARLIARQSDQAPWMVGAMVLAALAASKDPSSAGALMVGGSAAAAQTQLNFSRDMEREADRVGFGIAGQAGFAPQGFVSMFEKLQQSTRLNDSGGFPFLRSHPLTSERMADMQARIPPGTMASTTPASAEHALMAARARVLSNSGVDALQSALKDAHTERLARQAPGAQAGVLYAAVMAAARLRAFEQIDGLIQRLQALTRADNLAARQVRLLIAEVDLGRGQAAQALAALGTPAAAVNHRPEALLAAQAQLALNRPGEAADKLKTWLADHPGDAQAWQWLSKADAAQGRAVASIRDEAEVNVAQLDYVAAAARLRAAQDMVRKSPDSTDHFDASIVDTRARQVAQQIKDDAEVDR